MIIKSNDIWILKKYRVIKKNVERTESIIGNKNYDKYIQLYTYDYCLPNGAKNYLPSKNIRKNHKKINIEYEGKNKNHQFEALTHIIENEGGLIEAPTGSGKSHIIMNTISQFKQPALIVCPTKKLVKEMVDKFKEFTNYEPGTYYSDGKNIKDITITTHASFVSDIHNEKKLEGFGIVIVDEADDHLSEKMIYALCKCDCDILIGLTGTPKRQELDKEDLELIFGPHIKIGSYQTTPSHIIHYIYKWEGEGYGYNNNDRNRHILRKRILDKEDRFNKVTEKIKENIKNSFLTLILLDRIEEIEKISKKFPGALVITGKTNIQNDENGIKKLRTTGGIILGSIKKMYRGVDIPECDNIIIASPVRFESNIIQCIGRALRWHVGKNKVTIYIINDSILSSHIKEQDDICKKEYGITPTKEYLNESLSEIRDESKPLYTEKTIYFVNKKNSELNTFVIITAIIIIIIIIVSNS